MCNVPAPIQTKPAPQPMPMPMPAPAPSKAAEELRQALRADARTHIGRLCR